jgi:hypothetical protein
MTISIQIGATYHPSTRGRSFNSFSAANEYARFLLGRYSDLSFLIEEGNFRRTGTIDLEPVSFHRPHQNRIITAHLRTLCINCLKAIASNQYPFTTLSEADREKYAVNFIETLAILNN